MSPAGLIFLESYILFAKINNTVKPAKNTKIPPIPFITPLELASKNESIPAPSILGICNSATEISTLGNPPTTVEVDCKDNKLVKLPNIPITPSTPINPTIPKITIDIKSF